MYILIQPFVMMALLGLLQTEILRAQDSDTTHTPTSTGSVLLATSRSRLVKARETVPRKAAIRSAILPGWGQVYNGKAWKVPIVYAVLGTTGGALLANVRDYKALRYAHRVAYHIDQGKDSVGSAAYRQIDRRLKAWLVGNNGVMPTQQLKYARDVARNDANYTMLYVAAAWVLNIIDATVDAHISPFDVSDDFSLQLQPGYSVFNRTAGLQVLLTLQ